MKPMIIALSAAFCCAVAMPASAQQHWQGFDDFDVNEVTGGCVVSAEYTAEGHADTRFMLFAEADRVIIVFTSLDWSKPADVAEVTFEFLPNEGVYTGPAAPITLESIYDGFATSFGLDVLDDFASADSLRVSRGDVVIDHINLSGSAATTTTLRRCTAAVIEREAAEAREKARFDYIAKDPFAPGVP